MFVCVCCGGLRLYVSVLVPLSFCVWGGECLCVCCGGLCLYVSVLVPLSLCVRAYVYI